MSTDQPVESSKIATNAIDVEKIRASAVLAEKFPATAITADAIAASEIRADRIAAGAPTPAKFPGRAIDPAALPGHDEIRRILQSEGAPPRITLDVGGSEDLDGDGLVTVSLGDDGHELAFEDA